MASKKDVPTIYQRRAIAALAAGESWADAATAAGVSNRTMSRWGADPAFRAALAEAGREQVAEAGRLMLSGLADAIGVIREMMTDTTAPAAVQLRAAQVYLERALAVYGALDMADRLDRIETLLGLVGGLVDDA